MPKLPRNLVLNDSYSDFNLGSTVTERPAFETEYGEHPGCGTAHLIQVAIRSASIATSAPFYALPVLVFGQLFAIENTFSD